MIRRSPLARRSQKVKPSVKKRRAAKRAKRALLLTADYEARIAVFERDEFRCVRCGKTERLQWHHVVSRRYVKLRHEIANGLTICAGCHLWFHHNPIESGPWFKELYPERWELLMLLKRQ